MAPGDCRSGCWGKTAHRRPPEGWQTDTLTPYWGEPQPRMESVVDTAVPGKALPGNDLPARVRRQHTRQRRLLCRLSAKIA